MIPWKRASKQLTEQDINWPGAVGTGMRSLHSDRDRSALNKELRIAMKRVNGQRRQDVVAALATALGLTQPDPCGLI